MSILVVPSETGWGDVVDRDPRPEKLGGKPILDVDQRSTAEHGGDLFVARIGCVVW
jgi:hypothetical protein